MHRSHLLPALRLGVLAVLVSAACAGRTGGSQPAGGAARTSGTAGEAAAATDAHQHVHELPATGGPGYTAADVRFMQGMIGHHAQALVMTALAPARSAVPHVLQLAEKIDISQRDEIEMMQSWLRERQQAVPDSAHMHAMPMPGMLTAQQLAQLEAARGRDFDRLFLTLMIQHHEGALEMVETLFASPGAAQDSDIFRFATDVDADQRDEIFVMRNLLDMLETTRGSAFR